MLDKKSIILMALLVLAIFAVGSVSAADNITADSDVPTDDITVDDASVDVDDSIMSSEFNNDSIAISKDSSNILKEENIVDFNSSETSGVGSLDVQFNDKSTGDISSWYWDFGDGSNSSEQNASHTYSKIGSYNVNLTVTYLDGTTNYLNKNNYINILYDGSIIKNPDFEITSGNDFGWVFNNITLNSVGTPSSGYKPYSGTNVLKFGLDGSYIINNSGAKKFFPSSFGQYINFDYINSISFYVQLMGKTSNTVPLIFNVTIDDLFNQTYNYVTKKQWFLITVDTSNISGVHFFNVVRWGAGVQAYFDSFSCEYNDLVHAEFVYDVTNIINNTVNIKFNNKAYGSITNFLWEFDDGTTSTEINPTHNFTSGSHEIRLTSSNANHNDTYSYDLILEFPSANGQIYKTIQEAIDNATDGDVIDIPADLSENIIINKNLTLNFNGNKLISSGSSPVIQVTGGAQATIKNITLENSNVISTDDESSLTITESNIADTNITLNTGNIVLDGNNFTGSFITIANANAVISNNNIANGGIKVTGGKSKINNNVLSGNDVAITQTEGETNITSNVITDNNIGVNITNGTSNINFNVFYNNNEVSLAYVGTVDATNNWFGVTFPSFSTISDKDVDIYAFEAESQPAWLILTLNTNETTLYSAQNYTIDVNLTLNSNGDDTSSLGVLPKFSLPVSTKIGEASAVNVENGVGEFGLITGTLTSNDVIFTINGEDYTLDVTVFKIEDRVKELETQLAEAQANATKLAEDLDNANQKVSNLTTQLNETQANATKLAEDLADANQKAENLTAQLGDAQKQIQTLSADLISTTVTANNLNIKSLTNGNIQVTLKANGTALANKTVNVIINGVVYNGTTDDNGVAKIAVKYSSAGTYYATVTFAGDDTYKSSIGTSKVVVSKKATKITAPKKSFKAKVKTKKVKITLKSGSTILKSKKITLKVNGKTYTAKTNSKGVATIKVTKLTKKGTFTYTVKFAGDKAYKAITKKGKITIK